MRLDSNDQTQVSAWTKIQLSLETRINVIFALLIRDMRTRFGRSHLGYLIAVAWPLTHLVVIVVIVSFANSIMPLGTDSSVFVATGVMPYILCLYPARMMLHAIEANRALFLFPVISPLDMIISRAIIEFLTAFAVIIVFCSGLLVAGVEIIPQNVATWSGAIFSIVYFSICMGVLNTVIFTLTKAWAVIFIGLILLMYSTAGIFVLPSTYSPEFRWVAWYNPLLHCVEWLRSAYYEGYGDDMLSKVYVLSFATCLLFAGLVGERFVRGKLMTPS
ncbi:capsular polysaccharide transport system permease protein [Ensifer adhaerens]|nr:capsular polysaccharide transport system permease protein [Ensifer adhaerens]